MKLVKMMTNVIKLTSIKYSWSKYFPSYKIISIYNKPKFAVPVCYLWIPFSEVAMMLQTSKLDFKSMGLTLYRVPNSINFKTLVIGIKISFNYLSIFNVNNNLSYKVWLAIPTNDSVYWLISIPEEWGVAIVGNFFFLIQI